MVEAIDARGWRDRLAPGVAAGAVRLVGATLRVTVDGVDALTPLWTRRQPIIYIAWHGRILMSPWVNERLRRTRGARAATVLASRSRDGELVARWVMRFGLSVVRGSSSRGGAMALRSLAAVLARSDDVVVVPDGPRGPARELHAGVVSLAALTGAPVVPFAVSASPAITLGTWDRFQIPLPFARAAVVFGAPITVARDVDRAVACRELAAALDAVTDDADRRAAQARANPAGKSATARSDRVRSA
jgi:lysophospholipid acyltransferase (LPLAT)-like uncharacterized protein